MIGPERDAQDEHWRSLCEQTAQERDLERRIELVRKINRLLIHLLVEEKDRLNLIRFDRAHTFPTDK